MTFPSSGCSTCKQRRIKVRICSKFQPHRLANLALQCDEAQPVCQKCAKAQRTCSGMRPPGSVVHIENSYASGKRKRPRGPRSTRKTELMSNPNFIFPSPIIDLRTQAITYYLNYHLQTFPDALNYSKSVSDEFLAVWKSRPECPILDLAISSMALAVFSNTQHHPPAALEASAKYQQLLRRTQKTILSLDEATVDTCLLSIFFMARYEQAAHESDFFDIVKIPSFAHHDGTLAILKIWKYHLSHKHPASNIIKHSRRGMIRSALLRKNSVPEWLHDGSAFGEQGLELEYDCISIRIANLRNQVSMLLKEAGSSQPASHEVIAAAEELSGDARAIDTALQDWMSHFPTEWAQREHTLPSSYDLPSRDFYYPIVFSYSRPAYAAPWNHYYAMRLLINSTRLRVINVSHSSFDDFACDLRSECLSHIQSMANGLASSLPFCLQKFRVTDPTGSSSDRDSIVLNANDDVKPFLKTNLTVWPLSIASGLGDMDFDQDLRFWFRDELSHLGRVIGDRVLERSDAIQWFEFDRD